MSLLEIAGLSQAFGDNILFSNAEFALNRGEHVGVVGQNGAGKSTFIKLCTGQLLPDDGTILWLPQVSRGYLDQYASIEQQQTIHAFLLTAFAALYHREAEMNRLYDTAGDDARALKKAAGIQEYLESRDFYNVETRLEQVATGLGLTAIGLNRPIGTLSGGQRAKTILAKLLLERPDVLLLDEPTNFLDKGHIAWLADYLNATDRAFLVVSHDFDFLERITTRICDIDNHKIMKYYGSYADFVKKKVLLREDYIRQYTNQQKQIKKTEEFIRKNMAGRKSRMARGRQKQLAHLDRLDALDEKEVRPAFHFPALPTTNTEHLAVRRLCVGYDFPVLSDLSFTIAGGRKTVITGFNGIGKSTLLKTLIGELPAKGGRFHFSDQVTFRYFSQDLRWSDETRTPLQIVGDRYPSLHQKEVRRALARCGILHEHARQAIGTLSGGEQAKVKLCLLTLTPCNFLILDEPTNHLDVQAKTALREALLEFPGTVLLVSHEEAFYRDWADQVIHIKKFIS